MKHASNPRINLKYSTTSNWNINNPKINPQAWPSYYMVGPEMIVYAVVYYVLQTDYIPIFIGFNNRRHTEHLPSVCSSLSHLVQWLTALLAEHGQFWPEMKLHTHTITHAARGFQQRRSDFMFSPPPSPPLHSAPVFPPSVQHLFFSLSTSFIILLSFWFTAALWSFIIVLFHCRRLIFQPVYTAVGQRSKRNEKTKLTVRLEKINDTLTGGSTSYSYVTWLACQSASQWQTWHLYPTEECDDIWNHTHSYLLYLDHHLIHFHH